MLKGIYKCGLVVCAAVGMVATTVIPGTAGELDGVTLRVGTWGGPWRDIQEEMLVPRLEAMGARVEFVTSSPQGNLARLIAARGSEPPIDVIEMIDATLPNMLEGDFLGVIDLSLVPNSGTVHPDRVTETSIATWMTQEGMCYSTERYEELGLEPPKSFADLTDPRLVGRVMLPDIASGGGLSAVGAISLAQGGDLQDIGPALELINEMEAVKFWMNGSEALTAFQNGDIDAAVIHAGWCVRATLAGIPIASAHPIITDDLVGNAKQGLIGVVKGTPNAKAAHIWMNEFLETEFQAAFAEKLGLVGENRESTKSLMENPLLDAQMILDPEETDKMLRIDFNDVDISSWTEQWNRALLQ